MAEDVISRFQGVGDGDEPGEVVADEKIGSPKVGLGVENCLAAYIEELQGCLVDVLLECCFFAFSDLLFVMGENMGE